MKKILGTITLLSMSTIGFAADDCKKEEAKKAVEFACTEISKNVDSGKKAVSKYRFCGQNYVWLQDTPEVRMVLHPIKTKLNHKFYGGRNKSDLKGYEDKSAEKKKVFIEFDKMANAKPEGGWVDYMWPKPGAEESTPKTSFVKRCAGTNIVAGSGVWK